MSEKGKPEIKDYKKEPYTRITFIPDYKRFDLEGLDNDNEKMLIKNVLMYQQLLLKMFLYI